MVFRWIPPLGGTGWLRSRRPRNSRRRAETDERTRRGVRVPAGARCADPLYAAHPRLLSDAGLWRALSLGALRRGAVRAIAKAAERKPPRADHDGGAIRSGKGRSGPGG